MIYLYSCKRCKTGVRMDYPIKLRPGCYYRQTENGLIGAGIWVNATYPDGRRDYAGDMIGLCSGCKRMMTFGPLKGILNNAVPCDARCTNARGHNCECSCGGENHGKLWGLGAALSPILKAA